MATTGPLLRVSDQRKRWPAESCAAARSQEERQTMSVPEPRSRQPKPLAAGVFQPGIGSFRLCLAAEGKSGKTVRMYTEAVQWFAAAHLIPQTCRTRWEQVSGPDIQWWMVWLLALQRFLRQQPVPRAAAVLQVVGPRGRSPRPDGQASSAQGNREAHPCFHQRRTIEAGKGLRGPGVCSAPRPRDHRGVPGDWGPAAELAGIVYDAEDAQRSDVDLWQREITVRGKSGKARIVRISHQTASASTATSGSGHGMPRRTGRSCGWE